MPNEAVRWATIDIQRIRQSVLSGCAGHSEYNDATEHILTQAAFIELAALAHYNIISTVNLLRTLLDNACEYPPFLDTDDAAYAWMTSNPQAQNDAYFEAADTVAQILIEVGEKAVPELVGLAEHYTQSTHIEMVANAIANIGGPQALAAIEKMLDEYPIFKQPYFSAPEMVWQTEYWRRSAAIKGGAAEARYSPVVVIGDGDVSLRGIVQYVTKD